VRLETTWRDLSKYINQKHCHSRLKLLICVDEASRLFVDDTEVDDRYLFRDFRAVVRLLGRRWNGSFVVLTATSSKASNFAPNTGADISKRQKNRNLFQPLIFPAFDVNARNLYRNEPIPCGSIATGKHYTW
jgi:hypothetical protein